MTAAVVLGRLREQGIEVVLEKDNLRVRSQATLTQEQILFLQKHKSSLVDHLSRGEIESDEFAEQSADQNLEVFKEYKMPDGEILRLTKEEFDQVVEVFKLLLNQDIKNNSLNGVA